MKMVKVESFVFVKSMVLDRWGDGWMHGCMGGKAILRIAARGGIINSDG